MAVERVLFSLGGLWISLFVGFFCVVIMERFLYCPWMGFYEREKRAGRTRVSPLALMAIARVFFLLGLPGIFYFLGTFLG